MVKGEKGPFSNSGSGKSIVSVSTYFSFVPTEVETILFLVYSFSYATTSLANDRIAKMKRHYFIWELGKDLFK